MKRPTTKTHPDRHTYMLQHIPRELWARVLAEAQKRATTAREIILAGMRREVGE